MENMIGIGKRTVKIDDDVLHFSFDFNAKRIANRLQGNDIALDISSGDEAEIEKQHAKKAKRLEVDVFTSFENMIDYIRAGLMSGNPTKQDMFTVDFVEGLFYAYEEVAKELNKAVMEAMNLQKKMTNSMMEANKEMLN